jgi:hypothetical protein
MEFDEYDDEDDGLDLDDIDDAYQNGDDTFGNPEELDFDR